MVRTQISLTQDELDLLDTVARANGASRSELIRRAVRQTYSVNSLRGVTPEDRAAAIESIAGIWKDRPFTTEQYLDAVRHGRPLPGE